MGGDEGQGVVAAEAVEHQQAHGHGAGPTDARAAVHEEVLAAVEPLHGAVEERADVARLGACRSGIGNHIARPPSCSWSQAT